MHDKLPTAHGDSSSKFRSTINYTCLARCEVCTVRNLRIRGFRVMWPSRNINNSRRFEVTNRLHLQGYEVRRIYRHFSFKITDWGCLKTVELRFPSVRHLTALSIVQNSAGDKSEQCDYGRTGGGLKQNCAQTGPSQCNFFHDKWK